MSNMPIDEPEDRDVPEGQSSDDNTVSGEEEKSSLEGERDVEMFEQLMHEVKSVADSANDLSDAERRSRAEQMIGKVIDTFNFNDV
jgi:hypothetical protein